MNNKKTVAIVLAAGTGKRMNSSTAKQYLLLGGKPILYYSIKAFEESSVDEIILVTGKSEIDFCKNSIVDYYNFKKVQYIIEGGKERYHSVFNGLKKIDFADYVLIHDGVRPFISVEIIEDTIKNMAIHKACVVGVPSKDTIKSVNQDGIVIETPDRDKIWSVQTPQAFSYDIIKRAYCMIMEKLAYNKEQEEYKDLPVTRPDENLNNTDITSLNITDDAMVVEYMMKCPIKMIMGSYRNIKITTPEDLIIGEALLEKPCEIL
ncbi:IspD/TarI family cytidylyltransferase [Anaerocolumna sp. MB42-C2]|uniref:IspD/TarI family cytidylyltransferase n=1 Tax=Anaerocolumna sp. MB42-C2 TaxID=3070997 RepID=UPI0027E0BE7E|nr:2-C-methyl-D-erythritol 4-phosphate cytidylyltransferase [Anaerocolumna sp. MB42-C2]WMJ85904.1 2-C-methyl-D-erythritol 4-phosphate cytidylyltransferase [Anaerocolumna sp. MB42-C2]